MDLRLALVVPLMLLAMFSFHQWVGVNGISHQFNLYLIRDADNPDIVIAEVPHSFLRESGVCSGEALALTLDGEKVAKTKKWMSHGAGIQVERWNLNISELEEGWHRVCLYSVIYVGDTDLEDWYVCNGRVLDRDCMRYVDYTIRDTLLNNLNCSCQGYGWEGMSCPEGIDCGDAVIYAVEHGETPDCSATTLCKKKICRDFYKYEEEVYIPPEAQPRDYTPLIILVAGAVIGYLLLRKKD